VTFVATRQLGVYRAEVLPAPASSAPPGATLAPTLTPTIEPSPGARAGTQDEPLLFAVDLFSAEESNIRPGDGARVASLGTDLPPDGAEVGTARDEFWPLLVTLALLFLVIEWLVYERDGARRILYGIRGANPFRARRAAGAAGAGGAGRNGGAT
jgi:hypothetical protein